MLAQCAYIYENEHRCGRIPRHGETLCRDHRNRRPPRARCDEDAFDRAMSEVADRFSILPLPALLEECNTAIAALYPLIDNKASAEERAAWFRASIAINEATDRLDAVSIAPSQPTPQPSATAKQLHAELEKNTGVAHRCPFHPRFPLQWKPAGTQRPSMHLKTKCIPTSTLESNASPAPSGAEFNGINCFHNSTQGVPPQR